MLLLLIESGSINYCYLTEDGITDCVYLFFLSLKIGFLFFLKKIILIKIDTANYKLTMSNNR